MPRDGLSPGRHAVGGTLNEDDVEAVFRLVVPSWLLRSLDVQLGTEKAVRFLKSHSQCVGAVGGCEDGPYTGPESWSRWIEPGRGGFAVRVIHHHDGQEDVLRAGLVSWNRIANMATVTACELRPRPRREPAVGEQIALSI